MTMIICGIHNYQYTVDEPNEEFLVCNSLEARWQLLIISWQLYFFVCNFGLFAAGGFTIQYSSSQVHKRGLWN